MRAAALLSITCTSIVLVSGVSVLVPATPKEVLATLPASQVAPQHADAYMRAVMGERLSFRAAIMHFGRLPFNVRAQGAAVPTSLTFLGYADAWSHGGLRGPHQG